MANRFPLQPADASSDLSDYSFSPEADRRSQQSTGANPAGDMDRPEGRLWKVGQAVPNDFLMAPFPVVHMDGDNNGSPAEVHEIDILKYGDCYDPTAPIRVRTVDNYKLDSDNDGHLN
jgi:hypothetical protein